MTATTRAALAAAMAVLALSALVVVAGCDAPSSPQIRSLSFTSIPAGTMSPLLLTTEGCNPVFDLDLGTVRDDPTAVVVLDPLGRQIDAQRMGAELFQTTVPTDLAPGSYAVTLVLSDGRRAPYAGRLDVLRSDDPVIDEVASPVFVIEPGDRAVPLRVAVRNPSACTIAHLAIAPRFLRNGSDDGANFAVAPVTVTLAPGERRVVPFAVDVAAGAPSGEIVLDGTARDGERTGSDECMGPANGSGARTTTRWVLVPAERRVLEVVALQVNPRMPQLRATFNLNVTLRNTSGSGVLVQDLTVTSSPDGVVRVGTPMPNNRTLGANEMGPYRLDATSTDTAPAGMYSLRIDATARDTNNNLYATPRDAPTFPVVLQGQ